MSWGSLIPCLVVMLVAVPFNWQYVYSGWKFSEMDASAIQRLILSSYSTRAF